MSRASPPERRRSSSGPAASPSPAPPTRRAACCFATSAGERLPGALRGRGIAAADGDLEPGRAAGVYRQAIPSSGYGYLTTRDGARLAINVHPPQDVADALPTGVKLPPLPQLRGGVGATPTLIEYSGYGYADPAGPQSGNAVIANLMGFAVVDGRDDGHLLRRHQPALHRAAAPAERRRDLAAVGDRRGILNYRRYKNRAAVRMR